MVMQHTSSGLILSSKLGDRLGHVQQLFDRGPDVPMDYAAEFNRDASLCRERAMEARTPQRSLETAPSR